MTASSSTQAYSHVTAAPQGTTGTGLDQMVDLIALDPGLAGNTLAAQVLGGAAAADGMNRIIVEAATAVGAVGAGDAVFTAEDVLAMNQWIRDNRLAEWTALHGDDEGGTETGFHLVQDNGGLYRFDGKAAIDTVLDGVYHLGFAVVDGRFVNEDGAANASVAQVASWLTQFFTDQSTTGTGLDRIADMIMADSGLQRSIAESEIEAGADAANGLSAMIADGIAATGIATDGAITFEDVYTLNAWFQADAARYAQFVELHGDDEGGVETGFHIVQNDGSSMVVFGENFVNTVADGMFHIGFDIENEHFVNEDGDQNASVEDVAAWIDFFYSDVSTTGTGLDIITDTIKRDPGLIRNQDAASINEGARAADGLNQLLLEGLEATGALADGWVDQEDLVAVNAWVKADEARYALFVELHGDDEGDEETGFHNVQNDGSTVEYFGENLINTVADGIYHFGFDIMDGRFLNEDGDENQTLEDVSAWLNYFVLDKTLIQGDWEEDTITGTGDSEFVLAGGGDDLIDAGGGDDYIVASWGCDTVQGGAGDDVILGGSGDDSLDGGDGSDVYKVSGNEAGGWSSFEGFDTYADTGTTGTDTIRAIGDGDVDIGLEGFSATNGIEVIDGTGAAGTVRLLGSWESEKFDFSKVALVGGNFVIDAGGGNDSVVGSAGDDVIVGAGGDDVLNGAGGSDTYRVTGRILEEDSWSEFQGYDSYTDKGTTGVDRIVATSTPAGELGTEHEDETAVGDPGDVDIGLKIFTTTSGIEEIDATGVTGTARLLGNWESNKLDFSATKLIGTAAGPYGTNILIDGGWGADTIIGSSAADVITGGGDNDSLNGGQGGDTFLVRGFVGEEWYDFEGFDTYADTGTTGTDRILAVGDGDVDIGLKSFAATNGIEVIDATGAAGTVRLLGDWAANKFDFSKTTLIGSNIVIDLGDGNDTVVGSAGADRIVGGRGNDSLNGGEGGDTFVVGGAEAEGWEGFQGYDTYADTGKTGSDRIVAVGEGDVDIGLKSFTATNGIEVIDATGAAGTVRLLGDWAANKFDFSKTTMVGTNIVIDLGDGNDTVVGSAGADRIVGGRGNDSLNGGEGGDTFVVTGNEAEGWEGFQGYDTYADTGKTGSDRIVAVGEGDVDIGLKSFTATNGIDVIDATGAAGTVRLLGDWAANRLDFSKTTILGDNVLIDGGSGNDTIVGSAGGDEIHGGSGADMLTGGAGGDAFVFDTAAGTGVDRIMDFQVGVDELWLDAEVFTALGLEGDLAAGAFTIGTKALAGDDRLIYNQTNGYLYYDADGSGAEGQILVARMTANLALTAGDFLIV